MDGWLAPSETGLYRIGCDVPAPDKASTNLATTPPEMPALQKVWSVPGYGGVDPLVQMVSDTSVAAEGRHSLKVLLPSATPLVIALPGEQLVPQPPGYGWAEKTTVPTGFNVTEPSITLLPGRKYEVALAVQATPPGTTVEVMGGHWTVVSNVLHEYAPSARCTYSGEPLGRFVAGAAGELPGSWGHLTTTVAVPEATAMTNGTALQLRITPPESERGLGATVWLDGGIVREAK